MKNIEPNSITSGENWTIMPSTVRPTRPSGVTPNSSCCTAGTLPTNSGQFVGLLIGVILILGGLQFFPARALGPIVEHFQVLGAVAGR